MNLTNDKSALISAGVELYISRVWLYVWSTVPSWKLLMVHIYVFLVQTVRKLKTQQDREFLLESSWNGRQSDSIWPDHQEHHLFLSLSQLCCWPESPVLVEIKLVLFLHHMHNFLPVKIMKLTCSYKRNTRPHVKTDVSFLNDPKLFLLLCTSGFVDPTAVGLFK